MTCQILDPIPVLVWCVCRMCDVCCVWFLIMCVLPVRSTKTHTSGDQHTDTQNHQCQILDQTSVVCVCVVLSVLCVVRNFVICVTCVLCSYDGGVCRSLWCVCVLCCLVRNFVICVNCVLCSCGGGCLGLSLSLSLSLSLCLSCRVVSCCVALRCVLCCVFVCGVMCRVVWCCVVCCVL